MSAISAVTRPIAMIAAMMLALVAGPVAAEDDKIAAARAFIEKLSTESLQQLINVDLTDSQSEQRFRELLHENFDVPTIGKFVLGRYWRVADPDQQSDYLRLFEDMIVDLYAYRFSEYNGEQVEITSAFEQGRNDVMVRTRILGEGPPLNVDWRVRLSGSDGPRIIDIAVEGVSLSVTQRQEFSAIIERNGGRIDALLEALRNDKVSVAQPG